MEQIAPTHLCASAGHFETIFTKSNTWNSEQTTWCGVSEGIATIIAFYRL